MRPAFARCLVATVILGCGGATCLYSGAGPIDAGGASARASWNPVLGFVADLLTVPIPTPGIADVRDIVLMFFAAVLLGIAALGGAGGGGIGERWIRWTALVTIVLAILSAVENHSPGLSRGWIVQFAAGAAMAVVIGRRFSIAMVRQTSIGLLAIGLAAMILSLWHRSDRGLAHVTWPIGPITISAALAAVWTSAAGGWAAALAIRKAPWSAVIGSFVPALLGLYLLDQTGRRAPLLGLTVGWAALGWMVLWSWHRKRPARMGLVCAAFAAAAILLIYVRAQATSPIREKSGPIAARLGYWKASSAFLKAHPGLGIGPGRTAVDLTNALTADRAESPWIFEGNIDPFVHNEWLQATAELGVPGGLAYAALPLGLVWIGLRRHGRRDAEPGSRDLAWMLIAGLLTLVLTEFSSITLRGPIMPIWYWTGLGLLAALCRDAETSASVPIRSIRAGALRLGLSLGTILGLWVCFQEVAGQMAERKRDVGADGRMPPRLFPEKTLNDRWLAAVVVGRRAQAAGTIASDPLAIKLWRNLYELWPGYEGVPEGYADILNLAGQREKALRVARETVLGGHNPYSLEGNVLLAEDGADRPLRCVQRALRAHAMDPALGRIIVNWMKGAGRDPVAAGKKEFADELARLSRVKSGDTDDFPRRGEISLEALRVLAFICYQSNDKREAIAYQQAAADWYRRLEAEVHRYRRAGDAEMDAFHQLAVMMIANSPPDIAGAFSAIREAERYAVLGIAHEKLAHPSPELGFVGGEVVPTEYPARLRPMWRLSAFLHLAAGSWQDIDMRILASLPPEKWTANDLNATKKELALAALKALEGLPQNHRPRYYDALAKMAGDPIPRIQRIPSTQP